MKTLLIALLALPAISFAQSGKATSASTSPGTSHQVAPIAFQTLATAHTSYTSLAHPTPKSKAPKRRSITGTATKHTKPAKLEEGYIPYWIDSTPGAPIYPTFLVPPNKRGPQGC